MDGKAARIYALGILGLLGAGCEGNSAGKGSETNTEPAPTETKVVEAFTAKPVFFTATDNQRKVDAQVAFPAQGPWKQVTLDIDLGCPDGKCDWWDRWGYIGVVNGETRESTVTEILRFATPFRVGAKFTADVTALQPLLTGNRRLRVFIDTWVGPGHANGNGWLVDARFTFQPGKPDRLPIAVVPVYDVASFEAGDPMKPIATSVPPKMVQIPANAGAVELHSFITGHGQGNLDNCAEFCPKTHNYAINGMTFNRRIWRDDCVTTAVKPQGGTWMYPRAGWCPGAVAQPWVEDVSGAAAAGASIEIAYSPETYVNSCRPGGLMCAGCVNGNACAYDDGQHTAPTYAQSALLVVYAR